jgi:hypothetical protein
MRKLVSTFENLLLEVKDYSFVFQKVQENLLSPFNHAIAGSNLMKSKESINCQFMKTYEAAILRVRRSG